MPPVILVCGDRDWTDRSVIFRELLFAVHHDFNGIATHRIMVIDGEAPGADTIGHEIAKQIGFQWRRFPADWKKFHRAAGPIRNQEMLDVGKPQLVLAFHADIEHSKGTKDMIKRANKSGIPVRLYKG